MSIRDKALDIIEQIGQGKTMDAFERYYADDVVMQENANPPFVGKDVNREREKAFLASVKEWTGFATPAVAAQGEGDSGTVFIQYDFSFINTDDQRVRYQQIAVQTWKNGQIVHERFYYDTGA